jgi:hypothetical protein
LGNGKGSQDGTARAARLRGGLALQDPVTGEFAGISAAFEIEGTSAFLPPQRGAMITHATKTKAQSR